MKMNSLMKKMIVTGMLIGLIATTAYAENKAQPGSANDPIVTKSYVDEQLALLRKQLGVGGTPATPTTESGKTLKLEKLSPGQKLYGFEGTEFIVRSGKAVAVSGINGDGLSDITDGKDLHDGDKIAWNHLLLIARSDSRGIKVEAGSGECWVMIRGDYEIK